MRHLEYFKFEQARSLLRLYVLIYLSPRLVFDSFCELDRVEFTTQHLKLGGNGTFIVHTLTVRPKPLSSLSR